MGRRRRGLGGEGGVHVKFSNTGRVDGRENRGRISIHGSYPIIEISPGYENPPLSRRPQT